MNKFLSAVLTMLVIQTCYGQLTETHSIYFDVDQHRFEKSEVSCYVLLIIYYAQLYLQNVCQSS